MLGFISFSGAPISSVGGSVIYSQTIKIIGEAYVDVFGEIAGSGWTRINPDSTEWDYQQSSDWNKIK